MKESAKLDDARAFEKQNITQEVEATRPVFHLSAPVGWINDPNGFSLYQDEYHLFYQYYPYGMNWGPMHWGHSKTKDFITWQQLPAALAPDREYDGQGCFSGSALEVYGKHVLMYTGVMEKQEADGERTVCQTQCIAIGDGINYEKLEQNPVITADQLPKGSSFVDFRDPRIWKENGIFYSIIGSRGEDGSGQLAVFSSRDLKVWGFEKILEKCNHEYGLMWECPDFFTLDSKGVILVSPQDMEADGLEFHGGNGTLCLIGEYDSKNMALNRETISAIDYGLDFYAPQTVQTQDGRRVMIGWMQSWDNHIIHKGSKWSGMMSIPRELSICNNKLYQRPIRELAEYYRNTVLRKEMVKGKRCEIEGISGRTLDMTIESTVEAHEYFEIEVAANEKYSSKVIYDADRGTMIIDRNHSGIRKDYIARREFLVTLEQKKLKLRIILDKYSLELFVNDGEKAATMLIGTRMEADGIFFSAVNKMELQIVKHDIVNER